MPGFSSICSLFVSLFVIIRVRVFVSLICWFLHDVTKIQTKKTIDPTEIFTFTDALEQQIVASKG